MSDDEPTTPETDAALPIPRALYSCRECYEDYSWPAEDLIWSPEVRGWVCRECWDADTHGNTRGTTLADEIKRQNRQDYSVPPISAKSIVATLDLIEDALLSSQWKPEAKALFQEMADHLGSIPQNSQAHPPR